jgi:hypothetical protein
LQISGDARIPLGVVPEHQQQKWKTEASFVTGTSRQFLCHNEYIEVEILALYLKHRFLRNLTIGPSELFVRGMPF